MPEILPKNPINVVARRTGLSPHVIRVWERRYGVIQPERSSGNRRLYSEQDIQRLFLLRRVTDLGHPISHIASCSTEELESLVGQSSDAAGARAAALPLDDATAAALLDRCQAAVGHLDPHGLREALAEGQVQYPHPTLMRLLLAPLMHWLGENWHSGQLRVAQEHLCSEIVRHLLVELRLSYRPAPEAPAIVLATPAQQWHEIGALMAAVTAGAAGWRPVYLGANLPLEEIAFAATRTNARAVGLSLVFPQEDAILGQELRGLRRRLPDSVEIVAGGRSAPRFARALSAINARVLPDLDDFHAFLDEPRLGQE